MPLGQRIAHMPPERAPAHPRSGRRARRQARETFSAGETWQSSGLLLNIEGFDDRDELVAPIAMPAR